MTYILYNPLANGGNGLVGIDRVQAAYAAQSPELLDITTLDARAFLTGLSADDQVILCGGDGTINRLVNALDGLCPEVPIYVWRFGTGNDFLRDVTEQSQEQSVLLNDYIRNLPATEVQGRRIRFINNCCCGVDGLVCELAEKRKLIHRKSRVNYTALAVRSVLFDYRTTSARVTVDGETREYKKVWMASVMNGRYVGGGMKLAPEQDRRSGELCCIVWHGCGRLKTLLNLTKVFDGSHASCPMFEMRYGREVEIELDDPTAMQLDGEVVSGVTRYTARK